MFKRSDELYLNDMLDSIQAIEEFIKDMEYDKFLDDRKTRSATIRELEVIGEASNHISFEIKSNYPDIDWRTIKDFRNILTHEYFGIDDKILWQIITTKLTPLKNRLQQILLSIKKEIC